MTRSRATWPQRAWVVLLAALLVAPAPTAAAIPASVEQPSAASPTEVPSSGVSWTATSRAGPAHTWQFGNAFGRTVQNGTQRLHLAYWTRRINGVEATDAGPYAGIYYVRSRSGATWSEPKRISQGTKHAYDFGLASSGSRVYVTWVTKRYLIKLGRTAPRVLYVRVNSNHGAATAWRRTIRLTELSGRVDDPSIAASGPHAYIAFTNLDTGTIRLASSHDRGVTWSKSTIGSTAITTYYGHSGGASVAADGATVVVTWLADTAGTINVRVSTDHGAHFGPVETVGTMGTRTGTTDRARPAVLGSRVAVAWGIPGGLIVRQRLLGQWGSEMTVPGVRSGETPQGEQVALQGTSRIAIAWSEYAGAAGEDDPLAELLWAESADGGASWFATQTLGTTEVNARHMNSFPSVAWPTASTRYVVWEGWRDETSLQRVYWRKGTGTPEAP